MRCVVIKPRRTQNRRSQNASLCKAGIESWYYDIAEWWESHQNNIDSKNSDSAFHGVTPLPTIRDKEPLQAGVKASHRKQYPHGDISRGGLNYASKV